MTRFSAIPSAAIEDERLTGADLNVLAALGYHTCKDGWCWPSQDTIAAKARLSRQFVVESMKRLVCWGYVERYIENNNTRKIKYRVILDVANPPEEAKPQPVVTPVASHDIDLSPHKTGPVASQDRSCRVTRHKQEPSNQTKEQDAALNGLFSEIWGAWSKKLKAEGNAGRGDGKAKTFIIFKRKAGATDPALIRTMALEHVRRSKGYLEGLSVWLNKERYDTGDNVVALRSEAEPSREDKLYMLEKFGRWDASWGPRPVRQEALL